MRYLEAVVCCYAPVAQHKYLLDFEISTMSRCEKKSLFGVLHVAIQIPYYNSFFFPTAIHPPHGNITIQNFQESSGCEDHVPVLSQKDVDYMCKSSLCLLMFYVAVQKDSSLLYAFSTAIIRADIFSRNHRSASGAQAKTALPFQN
jgi:hypothetical protein